MGGGRCKNKLQGVGVCKNHEKSKHPPMIYFEPESTCMSEVF